MFSLVDTSINKENQFRSIPPYFMALLVTLISSILKKQHRSYLTPTVKQTFSISILFYARLILKQKFLFSTNFIIECQI